MESENHSSSFQGFPGRSPEGPLGKYRDEADYENGNTSVPRLLVNLPDSSGFVARNNSASVTKSHLQEPSKLNTKGNLAQSKLLNSSSISSNTPENAEKIDLDPVKDTPNLDAAQQISAGSLAKVEEPDIMVADNLLYPYAEEINVDALIDLDEMHGHEIGLPVSNSKEVGADSCSSLSKSSSHNASQTNLTQRASESKTPEILKYPEQQLMDCDDIQQLQSVLVGRALGTTVFQGGPTSSPSSSMPKHGQEANRGNDRDAWMKAQIDFDSEGAANLAQLQANYKAKKRTHKATFEDDVEFIKAERAEKARQARLRLSETHPNHELSIQHDDDEDLFLPQTPESPSKRPLHANSYEELGAENEKLSEYGNRIRIYVENLATGKQNEEKKKAEEMVGINIEVENYLSALKKQKSKTPDAPGPMIIGKDQMNVQENGKGRGNGKGKKSQNDKKSTKRAGKSKLNQNYIKSLLASNVYNEANANLGQRHRVDVPSEKNKDKVLKALIAGIPLNEQREARGQKSSLLRATKNLGPQGRCSPDGNGFWRLKGMTSSLHHHQIIGASWMRERELAFDGIGGGIQADQMGLGKTIMMIATMISNQPSSDDPKCTLIVTTAGLVDQWMKELRKHVDEGVFSSVLRYQYSMGKETFGASLEKTITHTSVALTTYGEVSRSYPKWNPPEDIKDPQEVIAWWIQYYSMMRGLLHKIYFYRVVLDEAQAIKNYQSQTSKACRALMAKHRWAVSGTPILNAVDELYPYFKFLRIKHTGSLEVFRKNFCKTDDMDVVTRLHCMLKQLMIRRTHKDQILGNPIVTLPKTTEVTITLSFNPVERAIYNDLKDRYIRYINRSFSSSQSAEDLEKRRRTILRFLCCLRQLTAHPCMLQNFIAHIYSNEADVERLCSSTASQNAANNKLSTCMIEAIRKVVTQKKSIPIISTSPFEIFLNDICQRCGEPADDPYVTGCTHIYCRECVEALEIDAAAEGKDGAECQACGVVYRERRALGSVNEHKDVEDANTSRRPTQTCNTWDSDSPWVSADGHVLSSTKTAAVIAQAEEWLKDEPNQKIIIFSQWHMILQVLGRLCKERGWKYCDYHGRMSTRARQKSIEDFSNYADLNIMITSLKCGGVGLNLTMASRVINVDLWWNSYVEQQAFCRIYRIGQSSETHIRRFVIEDSIDERLQDMQDAKSKAIGNAMDNNKILKEWNVTELMSLFGEVRIGKDQKPFILVNDNALGLRPLKASQRLQPL